MAFTYFVVPEGQTEKNAIVACSTSLEAEMFADGESYRTGEHFDVIAVGKVYSSRKITVSEIMALQRAKARERLAKEQENADF